MAIVTLSGQARGGGHADVIEQAGQVSRPGEHLRPEVTGTAAFGHP